MEMLEGNAEMGGSFQGGKQAGPKGSARLRGSVLFVSHFPSSGSLLDDLQEKFAAAGWRTAAVQWQAASPGAAPSPGLVEEQAQVENAWKEGPGSDTTPAARPATLAPTCLALAGHGLGAVVAARAAATGLLSPAPGTLLLLGVPPQVAPHLQLDRLSMPVLLVQGQPAALGTETDLLRLLRGAAGLLGPGAATATGGRRPRWFSLRVLSGVDPLLRRLSPAAAEQEALYPLKELAPMLLGWLHEVLPSPAAGPAATPAEF